MKKSGQKRAHLWHFPHHHHFEKYLRKTATSWFKRKGYKLNSKYSFILEQWSDWHKNMILPEVANYIQQIRDKRKSIGQGFPLHK